MKRWKIVAPRTLELLELEDPTPGPGEVLVRITHSVVSPGTELYAYREGPNPMMTIPGYLSAGEVVALGSGVEGVVVGQRVRLGGPHESLTVARATDVVPLPDGLDPALGALIHLPSLGHRCIHVGGYRAGDDVAVVGLGLIGVATSLVALRSGARVHGLDVVPGRIEFARSLGIPAYDASEEGFADRVAAATLRGVDVVVDTSGGWSGLLTASRVTRRGTSIVVLGVNRFLPDATTGQTLHEVMMGFPARFHYDAVRIIGGGGHPRQATVAQEDWSSERAYAYLLDEVVAGRLDLAPLIQQRITPDRLPEVMTAFDEGRSAAIGVAIEWS
jgi:threonine dehydrogenase-like Zn-dependent dehydrogenase